MLYWTNLHIRQIMVFSFSKLFENCVKVEFLVYIQVNIYASCLYRNFLDKANPIQSFETTPLTTLL